MDYLSRNERFRTKSSKNAKPIGSLILDLPPSCLEFLPVSKDAHWAAEDPCFIVGTYDLQKEEQHGEEKDEDSVSIPKEQSRQGSLSLFKLKDDELTKIQTFPTPSAILDLHFYKDTSWFAVASSTGTISVYSIQTPQSGESTIGGNLPSNTPLIVPLVTHQVLEEDEIITSFAWDPSCERERPVISITSTTGAVMRLGFNLNFTKFEILNDGEVVSQHDFEAWCCAFSQKGETLFSGGDDSKLLMSSLTSPEIPTRKLPFHNAGVTAILPIPTLAPEAPENDNPVLLTGSYDDFIRVYLLPSQFNSKPKILAEKDIGLGGGGVWRLKFLTSPSHSSSPDQEEQKFLVLASCMRVGCKIIQITKSHTAGWTIEVLAQVGVHESMNYASDVVPLPQDTRISTRTIVSTSFYDRLLFVWKYDSDVIGAEVE